VWNRKEGRISVTAPNKQTVSEPLTDFQAGEFARIFSAVSQTKGMNSIAAIAKQMLVIWNSKHYDMIFREKHSAGLGGVLTQALIENRIMHAHDAVCASQGKEEQNMPRLSLMDEKLKQDIPGTKKKRKREYPSHKAPPFMALTEENILEIEKGTSPVFSAEVLADYCRMAGFGPRNSKAKHAHKLVEWRHKKKSSEESKTNT
jgi:hypothetical protein